MYVCIVCMYVCMYSMNSRYLYVCMYSMNSRYLYVCMYSMVHNQSVYIHQTVCMCMALTRLVAFSARLGQWKAAPSALS